MKVLIIFLFPVLFTAIDWKYFPHPYIWGSFFLGFYLLFFALKTKRPVAKILLYNLVILLFCLGLLEAGTTVFYVNHDRTEYNGNYFAASQDEILGAVPEKNIRVSSRKYYDNKLIYDATYTINKEGLRVTPVCEGPGCRDTILFFGCSFMYGEGLNDDQTVPFLVGELSKSKVYNFAFVGYGPHQMLSEIEHGLVEKVVDGKPKYVIFQTAFFQVERAVGYKSWDHHGPKYILSQDGQIKYAGHFDDSLMTRIINNLLEKSSIYQNFLKERSYINKKDIERYIAIVVAAQKEFLKKYPGLEFYVIYWDDKKKNDNMIVGLFQKEGIKVHLISDILPEYYKRKSDYHLFDGHPNFTANKYIAHYIIQNILHYPNT